MQNNQILAPIKKKFATIMLIGLLTAALSFFILVVKEKNFKVSTDYLIVQNQTTSQDFYTLSKSAEYIGKILNEGVYSEIFIGEVVKTGKVSPEFLPFDKKEKLKTWSNAVSVGLNPDLGIINVQVFDNDQKKALAISDAIAEVLSTKSNLFYGAGQNIDVKVLSGPVLEKNPSLMNIIAVSVGGFALGIMLSALWVISRDDRKRKDLFSHSANSVRAGMQAKPSPQIQMETAGNFMSDEDYLEKIREIGRE
ncbi:MAG: hypothetical protein HGA36_04260 [Candidatus Moranbacteria bacterium]|nr:hypothetical protein [Candidatus Moranbacteria bacterium]